MIRKNKCFVFIFLLLPFFSTGQELHTIPVNTPQELQAFFRYTADKEPLVSAHRGGARPGFPENCIETFENTLKHIPAILEVDPRYTKDSVIVLMHDATLERTTNGQGKVSDYTLEELKKFRLEDTEGQLTPYRIPTLDEALEWAKGKTVLILDRKDVPIEARIKKIEEQHAQAHAMIMAYSYEEARQCYRLNPDIMMEVFIPDTGKAAEFKQTGVPWSNIVAFVTHDRPVPADSAVFNLLHRKRAMCIVGSSRTIDHHYLKGKITGEAELNAQYKSLLEKGADIIEADLAIEAGRAISAP